MHTCNGRTRGLVHDTRFRAVEDDSIPVRIELGGGDEGRSDVGAIENIGDYALLDSITHIEEKGILPVAVARRVSLFPTRMMAGALNCFRVTGSKS